MIKTKRTIELEEENTRLQNEIKSLNNDIKRLKQRYNELDEFKKASVASMTDGEIIVEFRDENNR